MRAAIALVLLLLIVPPTTAARLPTVNGDDGAWGTVLNEFLLVSFGQNGTLRNASIGAHHLNSSAVNTTHILDGTIQTVDLAVATVTSALIVNGTIVAADIASEAVNSTHILDETITNDDILDETITGGDISDGSITEDDLASDAVTTDIILDATITGDDIDTSTDLNVSSVAAESFTLDLEEQTDSCSSLSCTATASCSGDKLVLFGFSSETGSQCDSVPTNCTEYCQIGETECEVTASGSEASVYIVCGNIA